MESEIFWGDGTKDTFRIFPVVSSGDQEIVVVSDANYTQKTRSKVLTFITRETPHKRVTLTVIQNPEQEAEEQ